VTSRAISQRAAVRRRAGLLALVAIFWLAQLQGLSHLVSHLSRDHAAPHALVCGDCVASVDAGAAPVAAVSVPARAAPAESPPGRPALSRPTDRLAAAHRSRAPPATPS
jgi:hypothetical protein